MNIALATMSAIVRTLAARREGSPEGEAEAAVAAGEGGIGDTVLQNVMIFRHHAPVFVRRSI
jgi:hypothetical protein